MGCERAAGSGERDGINLRGVGFGRLLRLCELMTLAHPSLGSGVE